MSRYNRECDFGFGFRFRSVGEGTDGSRDVFGFRVRPVLVFCEREPGVTGIGTLEAGVRDFG